MTDNTQYLSAGKLKELEAELAEISTKTRKEIAEALEYAKSLGDIRENSEYQEARAAQARNEGRIVELQSIIKNAQIVKKHHATSVEIGSTVIIKKKGAREDKTINIVGSREADFATDKISNESPVGKAMMGKAKGDSFTVETKAGKTEYSIVDIV